VPPHAGRQHEHANEALAGPCDIHRLYRHAALAQRQADERDVFGTYIHTYKFHEAVTDEVILDLKYEARDVPQRITSRAGIDAWFEQATKGLNNFQKALIRSRWATMEELMSAGSASNALSPASSRTLP